MSTHSPAHASAAPASPAPVRTAVGTAPAGPAPHPARSRIQGRQTLLRSVRAEWIKLWSLRSTWITSFIAIALTVLFGAGIAIASGQQQEGQEAAKNMITAGLNFGQIVVAVLGALIIPGEYASGQLRSWGSGLVFAGIALMALGFGFLLRSTAGAITVVVSLLFVILLPLQLAAGQWSWVSKIIDCLPISVSSAVSNPLPTAAELGGEGAQFLTHGQAIAVFAAWALVPLIAAWFVFTRRDA